MDLKAIYNISYGLFVLTAKDNEKDNGCIINTCIQVTSTPNRISITVNKQNYTHDMIKKTRKFNVSILDESAEFGIFEHFGFKSGTNTNKFLNPQMLTRSENGIVYLPAGTNAYISGEVIDEIDLGTHTMFIADVTDAKVLSEIPSVTYTYYHKNIKPAPKNEEKKGWVCKICGYVYEGKDLPEDFICPICKHGTQDFEKL